MVMISPDVMNPKSDDLERAYSLESFDRMIAQPTVFDPEETGRLFLTNNPSTKKDPDKYLAKQPSPEQMGMMSAQPNAMPNSGNGPLAAMKGNKQSTGAAPISKMNM